MTERRRKAPLARITRAAIVLGVSVVVLEYVEDVPDTTDFSLRIRPHLRQR